LSERPENLKPATQRKEGQDFEPLGTPPAALLLFPNCQIRFSLGRYTAIQEIDAVVDRLTDVLAAGSRLNAKPPSLVDGTDRRSL
jgi:hypothetical protein